MNRRAHFLARLAKMAGVLVFVLLISRCKVSSDLTVGDIVVYKKATARVYAIEPDSAVVLQSADGWFLHVKRNQIQK